MLYLNLTSCADVPLSRTQSLSQHNGAKHRHPNNDFPPTIRRAVDRVHLYCAVGSLGMWGGVRAAWRGIRCEVEQKGKGARQGSYTEQVL